MKLKDMADIQMGVILKRIEMPEDEQEFSVKETFAVLLPKAIENGLINKEELGSVVVAPKEKRLKFAGIGTIAMKLTGPYDAAYVTEEELVLPSYCVQIRVDEGLIDARYLTGALNTSYIRKCIEAGLNGAYGMAKIRDIQELDIPLPPMEKQKALGETYLMLCRKRQLLKELQDVESKISENLIFETMLEVLKK